LPESPLGVIAAAVLLGVTGQLFASLTRLPAIVFLLLLGVVAGPHGIGVVRPEHLGPGLQVVVSGFVAIILLKERSPCARTCSGGRSPRCGGSSRWGPR
jgi:NhaP-type Na+/H+ or K+/H+ antiporter